VHAGGSATPGCSAAKVGLSLAEAKAVLAGLPRHLVQAQAEEHCQIRRRCPRCGEHRPLKDRQPRQLRSLFGTVEVHAPRFEPCQCSVTLRTILSTVNEIMPDCCTPEYERVLAEFGALLPYRSAHTLLGTFFPVGDLPTIDTIQRRTLQVGARLECEAVATPTLLPPPTDAETIALSIALVTCARCAAIRYGPLRRSLRRPATMMASRSSSTACRSRLIDRPSSSAARCITLAQHRARISPSSAMVPTGRGHWGRRRASARPVACSTGSTWRCASSMSPRQSKAGPALRTETGRTAPSSPMLWSTSVGACGTARCSAHLI
jgi:hypothetical protein